FLANETILARPVTLRYQMGKLIARNKVVSAAVGVIFALVVGFGVIAVEQSVRIAAERDRANQEAATANEVAEFLVRLFRETNPTETDGVLTAKEILLSGRKRLDTELKQKPEIRARLLETIGNSFTVVGPVEEAVRAYEESLRLRGDQDARAARSLRGLSDAYYNLGRYEESVRAARRALELDQKFLDAGSETTSKTMNDLALSLAAKGDLDEAATLFAALEKRDQQYGRQETEAAGAHLAGYGSVLRRQKKYTEAIEKLTRGVAILRNGGDKSSGLRAMNDLGLALNLTKRFVEADRIYGELLRETGQIYGVDHPNNAVAELNRMNSWIGLKRYQEAAAKLEELRPRIRREIPLKHPVQCDVASAYAEAVYGMNPGKGVKLLEESIVFCSEKIGSEHPNVQRLKERREEIGRGR
ncbi:MAG: tetratricopeptide repeat protein, partial [Acidobacteriota bacterium]